MANGVPHEKIVFSSPRLPPGVAARHVGVVMLFSAPAEKLQYALQDAGVPV